MEIGTVRQVDIDNEMQVAYLDYAMSVIVARALPDARDGLKPVQRRILYAMHGLHLRPDTPYKKSARIVGEVLGKYHPHGDAAVYSAMARMAQDFSLRSPLVDGQGNFGSIDGDSPAAMRYTEARLAQIATDLLTDLDKDTVDFISNFDDTLQEPTVLPAAIPNLLVNGASGIAVGMSTSIPPHNLGEVCDALVYMLDHWRKLDDITVEDLMNFIQGPDFPTGGVIYRQREEDGDNVIAQAYGRGRGKITIRALAHVEEMSRSRHRIVVTELPYQVNKTTLIERIAKLARDGRIEGITDLRDESDRQGMRLVIELTRNVEPEEMLADLFQRTQLESTFSFILLALVEGEPRRLTLKKALLTYLEHRQVIVKRRSQHELVQARERAHILEGLLTALDNLDEVIETIRRSRTTDSARSNLRRKFTLSQAQAQAILDMPLKRLAALERRKIQDEYKEKRQRIKYLEGLLKSPKKIRNVVRDELLEIEKRYADDRRTQVIDMGKEQLTATDLIPDESVWVGISRGGMVARVPDEGSPPRVLSRPKDAPIALLQASTSDTLYLFAENGQAASFPVHQLSEGEAWEGAGAHYADLTPLSSRDTVVAALALPSSLPEGYLFLATRQSVVKRVLLADLPGMSADPFVVMGVEEGDALGWAVITSGEEEVLLVTAGGQAIRFEEKEVRAMGLPARGVMGIKLQNEKDHVVALDVARARSDLLVVTSDGEAKRTPLSEYPVQGRYGQGVIAVRIAPGVSLAGASVVQSKDPLVLTTKKGAAKTTLARNAPRKSRVTIGEELIALRKHDVVVDVFIPSFSLGAETND
ncbi:MAG: DNA gyrase subunit A [Chloroflexi bacterium]|nr:MAG: DNA gyrase subunit A [Chloroflexota bacterium]RLC77935.1 MAG: DNA gyrase subunit A [Chloroflexota bacterium]